MKQYKLVASVLLAASLVACGDDDNNHSPTFSSSTFEFDLTEDTSFEGAVTATDEENDIITFTVASAASNGIFALNSDGSFSYTPNTDFNGTDTVTVEASDGSSSESADITFSISAVNDVPVLISSNISATSSADTTGQISVVDVDGDSITYAVISQPSNGSITLDSATGEFTYSAPELSELDESFTISFTDNVIDTPIEAVIDLTPSFVTNQDKVNYYYSSDKSHLKRAEAISANINDDILLSDINAKLALGYMIAGFDDKATEYFDSIGDLYSQAVAYRLSALEMDKLSDSEQAASLRALALESISLYLAEKGVENITSDDAGFYLALISNFKDAGQTEEASALSETLSSLADAALETEGSAFGQFVNAAYLVASANVDVYLASPTDENYTKAEESILAHTELAMQYGTSIAAWWSDNADEEYEKTRPYALSDAIKMFYQIGSDENAKDNLNFMLSLYGITGLDDNYQYTASEFSAVTAEESTYYLASITGIVEYYYSELEANPALALLTNSWDIDNANASIMSANAVRLILNGATVSEVIETLIADNSDQTQRTLFDSLVESYTREPGVAVLLAAKGETDKALEVLGYGSDIMTSQTFQDEAFFMGWVTGYAGCARLTELTDIIGGDSLEQSNTCATMVNTYYTSEAGTASTSDVITGHIDQLITYNYGNNLDAMSSYVTQTLTEINVLDSETDKAEYKMLLASYLMQFGLPTQSYDILIEALAHLTNATTDEVTSEELIDAIDLLQLQVLSVDEALTYRSDYVIRYSFMTELAYKAGQFDEYEDMRSGAITALSTIVNDYTTRVLALSDKDITDNIETMIEMNFAIGNEDKVIELIAHDANDESDKLSLYEVYASLLASLDSFKSTGIASVDTDNDGKPNFFLPGTSDEDILASGLVADDDSDNDGILDEEDPTPLGE